MSRENDIKKLTEDHGRRLQKLKEQQALKGSSTDPSISLEIEDIEAEIEKLQLELDELETKAQTGGGTDTLLTQDATPQKSHKKTTIIEKLLSILRDRIWQAIGVVVAVLACFMSIISCDILSLLTSHTPTPTPTPPTIDYIGRVVDKHSKGFVSNALVIFEFPGHPPINSYTDTFGTYRFTIELSGDNLKGKVEVRADHYEFYNQEVTLHRDNPNIQEIRLTRLLLLTDTPTHTPTPTSTWTPVPTHTPTPILTVTPECPTGNADDIFNQVLGENPELREDLGDCHLCKSTCERGSYQIFQDGFMIWLPGSKNIHVFFSTKAFTTFVDTYDNDLPPDQPLCNFEPLEEGLYQPVRGFGKVWCDNEEVREKLGFATTEIVSRNLLYQSFDGGWLILIDDIIYALIQSDDGINGTWLNLTIYDYKTIALPFEYAEFTAPECNLELCPGEHYLTNIQSQSKLSYSIPFSTTGWTVSTQCSHLITQPVHIKLDTDISNPMSVYLLLQAGYGFYRYKDEEVGKVSLDFFDGSRFEKTLILGFNIRDWSINKSDAVTTATSSTLQPAWEGPAPNGTPGRMDILTIDIPDIHRQSTLKSIQISDTSDATTGVNPCIHLLAVTVRYLR